MTGAFARSGRVEGLLQVALVDVAHGAQHEVALAEDPADVTLPHAASADNANAELIARRNSSRSAEHVRGHEVRCRNHRRRGCRRLAQKFSPGRSCTACHGMGLQTKDGKASSY